ncbi:alpha-1,2-fucosyltransferase [bacterium]|nr:alpha-1,2-fucosyltransferase [bacterium]
MALKAVGLIILRDAGVLIDYYYRSLKELKDRLGAFTVFVFSDDVEAIQRELKLDLPHYFVKPDGKASSHEELHLMSLCNHAIISNSTFAWWGAWLNSSKEKIVVAPKPWHADIDPQFRDLKPVPSSWLSIDRNGVSNF